MRCRSLSVVLLLVLSLSACVAKSPLVISGAEIVAATEQTPTDVRIDLADGQQLAYRIGERKEVNGFPHVGDFLIYGDTPERWLLTTFTGTGAAGQTCHFVDSPAWDRGSWVELEWSESVSIAAPKAPGWRDPGTISSGALSGFKTCLDGAGRAVSRE